jgi:ABC-2 type transport system ATP-binding protein
VRVLGHDVVRNGKAARAALGVVPQELALYEDLTAAENLAYWGGVQGMRGGALAGRVGEVLERIGLADRAKEPVKRFSGGMQRRLNFGCGVVHRPKVLLLDEPTAGVDPQSRVRLLDLVREEAKAGTTVLYTTHYMEEAESLCQRLAIIDHGLLVAQGTLEELRALMGERDLLRLSGRFAPDALRGMLATHPALAGAELVQCDEKELVLALGDASRRLPAIFAALEAAGATVSETTLSRPSLESLFIKLTGKELRE